MRSFLPLAIVYDFDGTLAPGNMQERDFIPKIGMTKVGFWDEVASEARKHNADNILMYMKLMLEKAKEAQVKVRKSDFQNYGKDITFFEGVMNSKTNAEEDIGWFERINLYGRKAHISVNHFIVSSGIREMVLGTPIASKFKAIFASSFCYDYHGIAEWPALALNYTSKTQYLFRINKGCLDVHDHTKINQHTSESSRAVPFRNMIYIGDGLTDIPCMRVVNDKGGCTIVVFKPHTKGARAKAMQLVTDGRAKYIASAKYTEGSKVDKIAKAYIDYLQSYYWAEELEPR